MSKFEVGDRVTVTTPRGAYARPLVGRTGIVTKASMSSAGVDVTYELPVRTHFLFDNELELEPVVTPAAPKKFKRKVRVFAWGTLRVTALPTQYVANLAFKGQYSDKFKTIAGLDGREIDALIAALTEAKGVIRNGR